MASLLYTVGGVVVNAPAFGGGNLAFSLLRDHGVEEECKRHDLKEEELQRAKDKWNEDQMERLDFINKRLREKNEARAYINSVDDAILEYYRLFATKNKTFVVRASIIRFLSSIRGTQKMVNYYLL